MTPILYVATETSFTSLGIGALNETISCIVTENRNGSYELELKYPQTGALFSEIAISRIIKAQPAYAKNPEPFRIYKISKPFKGVITVNAEHISYQLSFIPVTSFSASNVSSALSGLKSHSAEDNPFSFETDKTTTGNFKVEKPASIRSLLGGISGSILDTYSRTNDELEYEFIGYTVKAWKNRGVNRGVTLRYGKNITDLKQEESISNTITGICPYWQSAEDDTKIVTLPEHCVYSDKASNFPYKRTIVKDFSDSFEEEPTEMQLRAKAQQYIRKSGIGIPTVSLDVKFVVLQQMEEYKDYAFMEAVNLCDEVNIEFESLNISAQAKVVTTKWNVLKDMYDSVTLGSAKAKLDNTLSELADATQEVADDVNKNIKEVKKIVEIDLQGAIDNATKQITGVDGGYVILHQDANHEPYEILIMDKADINEATKVWRWNKNGLGYSNQGYSGQYALAMTQDGAIVADRITAGKLAGITIEGNTIKGNEIEGGSVKGAEVEFDEGTIGGWTLYENGLYIVTDKAGTDGKYRIAYLHKPYGTETWVYGIDTCTNSDGTGTHTNVFRVEGDGSINIYDGTSIEPVIQLDASTKSISCGTGGIGTKGTLVEHFLDTPQKNLPLTCTAAPNGQKIMFQYMSGFLYLTVDGVEVGHIALTR